MTGSGVAAVGAGEAETVASGGVVGAGVSSRGLSHAQPGTPSAAGAGGEAADAPMWQLVLDSLAALEARQAALSPPSRPASSQAGLLDTGPRAGGDQGVAAPRAAPAAAPGAPPRLQDPPPRLVLGAGGLGPLVDAAGEEEGVEGEGAEPLRGQDALAQALLARSGASQQLLRSQRFPGEVLLDGPGRSSVSFTSVRGATSRAALQRQLLERPGFFHRREQASMQRR
jgi:hypothetical protein